MAQLTKKFSIFFGVATASILTQGCLERNTSIIQQSLNSSPISSQDVNLLSSSRCTELAQGRELNRPQGATKLDNASTLPVGVIKESDILYQTPNGWDPLLSQLDVITVSSWKSSPKKRPVVLYIHGGGEAGTDKGDLYKFVPKYHELYLKKGFVFVNANYRTFDVALKDPGPTPSNAEVTDIARAIKWIYNNISSYGGDPSQIVVLGFSNGAHISAMLGTNPVYLKDQGVPLDALKAVISVDVPHYDVSLALQLIKGTYLEAKTSTIKTIYGDTLEKQKQMSPVSYLENNDYVKPTLLISSGIKDGQPQTVSFPATIHYKNKLLAHGHEAEYFHFEKRTHTSLTNGDPQDDVNQIIGAYLNRIFSSASSAPLATSVERQGIFDKIDEAFTTSTNLPGAVYAYISPNLSMAVACGNRSLFSAEQRPGMHTIFSIGSVSKIFTGLVLARLIKENTLTLGASANSLLSDTTLKSSLAPSITLQQLVTHTSGLREMPTNLLADRDINGDGVIRPVDPLNPAANYSPSNLIACLQTASDDPWGRCQPRLNRIGTYEYSNLGIGLLGYSLMDQNQGLFQDFHEFFRRYVAIPLVMDDGFAEADEIKQLIDNFNSKDLSSSEIIQAKNLFLGRFAGLHNYSQPPVVTLSEAPQPDMGMLAGAGELKFSAESLAKFLRLMLGYQSSSAYPTSVLDEYHRSLFNDGNKNLSYAVEITTNPDGSLLYSKTGKTQGSGSYLTWSRTERKGLLVLSNSSPDPSFWKNSTSALFKQLSSGNF